MAENTDYDNNKIFNGYIDRERKDHPQRKYLIYPSWLQECGNIAGKKILDLGCGAGISSRMLARKGAKVEGETINKTSNILDIDWESWSFGAEISTRGSETKKN